MPRYAIRFPVLLLPLLTSLSVACIPHELLKATSAFAGAAQTTSSQVSGTAGIVTTLCRTEAQLDFLTHLAKDQTAFKNWADYYGRAPLSEERTQQAGGKANTWSGWCDGMKTVDDAFAKISTSIGAYGAALGQAVGSDSLAGTDIADITSSAADDVAHFVPWAKAYQGPLEGIGAPLQEIASGLVTLWVGKEVRTVVEKADQPLGLAIKKLVGFLGVVQSELLLYTNTYRASLLAQGSNEPLAIAAVDIDVSQRLDTAKKRLAAYSAALQELATAHATLKHGWDEPLKELRIRDAKAVGSMAIDISKAVFAFQTQAGGT